MVAIGDESIEEGSSPAMVSNSLKGPFGSHVKITVARKGKVGRQNHATFSIARDVRRNLETQMEHSLTSSIPHADKLGQHQSQNDKLHSKPGDRLFDDEKPESVDKASIDKRVRPQTFLRKSLVSPN